MMEEKKLKEVSKAKHHILQNYFYPWALILGSTHKQLFYVDCFAGEGKYEGGKPGSPLIIFRKAYDLTLKRPFRINLVFVEKNESRAERLRQYLENERLSSKLSYKVFSEDSRTFTTDLIDAVPYHTPVFFFIDPYGHPISIPVINQILKKHY
ncbi:MAG: three-Cys-motif partner protein TcmP, partial [Calditrichia bacterium]